MRFLASIAALILLGAATASHAAAPDPVPEPPAQAGPAETVKTPPVRYELTERAARERALKQAQELAKADAEAAEAQRRRQEWDKKNPTPYARERERRKQVGLSIFWLGLLCSAGAFVAPWFLIRKGRWIMLSTASGLALGGTLLAMLHIWLGDAGHEIYLSALAIVLSWVLVVVLLIAAAVGKNK